MKLKEIHIKNFRSCCDSVFPLEDFTPLVGYNNAGKSNILAAIKLLLKPVVLPESDFYNKNEPIILTGHITGIDTQVLANIHEKHRAKIAPFCNNEEIKIRYIQPEPNCKKTDLSLEIFDKGSTDWKKNPTGIPDAIKALFPEPIEIGAMDNVTEDVAKHKAGTTIAKLISEIMQPIEAQHGAAISQALNEIKKRLTAEGTERAPELDEFDNIASKKVQDLFPGIKIKMHVPPPEIKELFKNGTIKVFEGENEFGRDVESLGHGAQRSIQMALIRYLAEIRKESSNNSTRTMLLIDEPELYLHPQAVEQVRAALKELSCEGYQVVFTTHSPLMIRKEDISNALLVRKTATGTYTRKRITDAIEEVIDDAKSQARTLFETSNSNQVLFCDKVLIAEGMTESTLLPDIFETMKGKSLGASKIALVNLGGCANVGKSFSILKKIGLPTMALVDLDYAFRHATKHNFLEKNDSELELSKEIFKDLSAKNNFNLALDGFPTKMKGSALSPAEAFAIFADHSQGAQVCENLHKKLLKHNIWLWKKGTIEKHLGILGKGEEFLTTFLMNLRTINKSAITDLEGVKEFIEWLDRA